jgi:hypothetical protein
MSHIAEALDEMERSRALEDRLSDVAYTIADHLRALTKEVRLSRQLELLKSRREAGLVTEAEYKFGLEELFRL